MEPEAFSHHQSGMILEAHWVSYSQWPVVNDEYNNLLAIMLTYHSITPHFEVQTIESPWPWSEGQVIRSLGLHVDTDAWETGVIPNGKHIQKLSKMSSSLPWHCFLSSRFSYHKWLQNSYVQFDLLPKVLLGLEQLPLHHSWRGPQPGLGCLLTMTWWCQHQNVKVILWELDLPYLSWEVACTRKLHCSLFFLTLLPILLHNPPH